MKLTVIEHKNQRVLTTAQLAEVYGTDPKRIANNFNENKSRYKEGKHFILVQGGELRDFKEAYPEFRDNLKFAPLLYLWTEKGAWLHAKSLNTDQAWDAYETLVDDYYTVKENVIPLSKDQALVTVLRTTADLVEGQERIIERIDTIERKVDEQITIDHGEQRALQKAVARKVYELEHDPRHRGELFRQLHREIKDRWGVASYRDVRRTELQQVIRYVDAWRPRKVS